MWLFAMFDLPVKTREQRRRYARFRKVLLADGFSQLQYSVYARYCASEEAATPHREYVRAALPDEGQVRLLAVTDRQFGKMENYVGKLRGPTEEKPIQLMLF
ncbi:MAG: CRISPR-associated endonuclease Cas2 [Phycisphaerae bacterium]|nr:CRISPR-associated endonuclease Cas2 [Phycisphaerae bacterium]